jgi:hypothetical protein
LRVAIRSARAGREYFTRRGNPEIAQHTFKALHILLVILSVPKVANIARAKLRSPSLIRRHDGIVEADRK